MSGRFQISFAEPSLLGSRTSGYCDIAVVNYVSCHSFYGAAKIDDTDCSIYSSVAKLFLFDGHLAKYLHFIMVPGVGFTFYFPYIYLH